MHDQQRLKLTSERWNKLNRIALRSARSKALTWAAPAAAATPAIMLGTTTSRAIGGAPATPSSLGNGAAATPPEKNKK